VSAEIALTVASKRESVGNGSLRFLLHRSLLLSSNVKATPTPFTSAFSRIKYEEYNASPPAQSETALLPATREVSSVITNQSQPHALYPSLF
jgi:hypothetical protein